MSKSKHMDAICGILAALMVLVTVLYMTFGGTLLSASAEEFPYVEKLFSTDQVHRIDIVADEGDWKSMLQNARAEEYISCTAVIDGEKFANVAIRPKGNSSLSTVSSSDSNRYSFKMEFDHYDKNTTYHGLDKLCLNNAIQDNTYMKDYFCYRMMDYLDADAPLASFAWITVNGEDWGLYTAVEGVEDSFAQREYGADHGQIYKPDSMDMGGGGRGAEAQNQGAAPEGVPQIEGQAPDGQQPGLGGPPAQQGETLDHMGGGNRPAGGMGGSRDVLLVYSGDDPDNYPNIFDNAVFDSVTENDQKRLIQSLKSMNEGDVESSVSIDEVLRYFAVHNFVLNGDSYTGSIIHNYYLYEKDGLLSMIAWDYNLAFGGMGMGSQDATSTVNSPIDSPVSDGDLSSRPMVAWIFADEGYTNQYHQAMDQLVSGYFESGQFEAEWEGIVEMISPYVKKDPTAFCTYAEFEKGAETLRQFCLLRAESVRGQLNGSIPSTSEGQTEDTHSFVDASGITIADMGSQGGSMGFAQPDNPSDAEENHDTVENTLPETPDTTEGRAGQNQPMPGGMDFGQKDSAQAPESDGALGGEACILLGTSGIILLAGLLFAKFYR